MLASALYFIVEERAESAFCMSTISLAEGLSKERLSKIINTSPRLIESFGDPKARTSANTISYKEASNGGYIVLIGSNSSAEMRSRPLRCLWLDEVSSYAPNKEGDVVELLQQRQATFFNAVTMLASTPLLVGDRIDGELSKTDYRKFFVPCPHCDHKQFLRWAQFKWPKKECFYFCEVCDQPWEDWQRHDAVKKGEWRPTRTPDPGYEKVPGFHLPGLYSPWETGNKLMNRWLKSQGDPLKLQTFLNTKLAEGYQVSELNLVEWETLLERAEDWQEGTVPLGGLVLTAGVDVQKDRLVVVVDAWGQGLERWTILYLEINGDPLMLGRGESPWDGLVQILETEFKHDGGKTLKISRCNIDSGNDTDTVYRFVRTHQKDHPVFAVKGLRGNGEIIVPVTYPDLRKDGKRQKKGIALWGVGVSKAKKHIYSRLKMETFGYGYHHFPLLNRQFFKELVSEKITEKFVNGFVTEVWELPEGADNHALDCAVYSLAAAYHLRLDKVNYPWAKLRKSLTTEETLEEETSEQPTEQPPQPAPSRTFNRPRKNNVNPYTKRKPGSWLTR